MKNRLREIVDAKVAKININKKGREKKYRAKFENMKTAKLLKVSFSSVDNWYHNRSQPKPHNQLRLARLYKKKFGEFFYAE